MLLSMHLLIFTADVYLCRVLIVFHTYIINRTYSHYAECFMINNRMCIVSVHPVLTEVKKRILATNAPFTAEQWICNNLAEIKAIPMSFTPNRTYSQGAFGDLVSLLHNTVDLPAVVVDKDVDYRFVGNTLLLSF